MPKLIRYENYSSLTDSDVWCQSDSDFPESLELIEQSDSCSRIKCFPEVEHPTSYSETLTNFIKGLLGTGIFSLPCAFAKAGYLGGTIGLIFLTYFSVYAAYILIITQMEMSKRRNGLCLSFQETVEAAIQEGPVYFRKFAPLAKPTVKTLIGILSFGSACVYNIVIAETLKQIMDPWIGNYHLNYYMIFMLPFLLPLNLVRSLKYIAPISCLSNFLMIFILSSIIWYFLRGRMPSFYDRSAFGNVYLWPQFAGTVFFANSCITLILPLQNEMKDPKMFGKLPNGVLVVGCVLIMALYWVFGFFGYIKYGDKVYDSVTLNLPQRDIVVLLVHFGVVLSTLAMTPLNFYVLFEILDNDIIKTNNQETRYMLENILRVVVVLLSVLLSVLVPNINLLVSFLGIGANCVLAMFLPSFIYLITFGLQLSLKSIILNAVIIVLSVVLFIFGLLYQIRHVCKLFNVTLAMGLGVGIG